MSPMEFMLRFTLNNPDMGTTIVGTANPAHLKANVATAAKRPIARELMEAARTRFPGV
jgi:aryl-alcohol dehydrogenase-like predicted oxidoreductase